MEKLKQKWGIKSNWAILAILIVFAINGSFSAWVAKPVCTFFGITIDTLNPWIYWPLRILLIFPIYQLTLPIVGWLFGQFNFFWEFEKKFLSRLGLGFLFKKS
ncbi:MAG: diacylglyceryl transferase [Flavobacteriaceae bacterium]|nr:diacylglyceryl transferase [Flavobacteriaceae bacterium]